MFKNYLKATYRHLIKRKITFLFKLGGLPDLIKRFYSLTKKISNET
jgi:hypothetical protein